jgi:hypothetical protein
LYCKVLRASPIIDDVKSRAETDPAPASIHDEAIDNLRFIRSTLERAESFTGVPGIGGVAVGVIALLASIVAHLQPTPLAWFAVWIAAAAVAATLGIAAVVAKLRRVGGSPFTMQGRRFALSYTPPLLAGAIITAALAARGHLEMLPAVWLVLYGTAVVAGGAFSVRIVPVMGILFILLGCTAFVSPASWADAFMAVGFGGLHLVFGAIIARHHGG